MKDLTYDQLIELAPKDRPFQIEINREDLTINKRFNLIEKSLLWAFIDKNKQVNTNLYSQTNVSGSLDYTETGSIAPSDKSRKIFTLIDPRYTKPEVLKVGQKVRIMESVKDVGEWIIDGAENLRNMASLETKIDEVWDNEIGVNYRIGMYKLPHYCVMPVEEEEVQEIPELGNTLKQLDNLVSKAQDIISKYKK
jgi:hypothetical protein